MALISSLQNPYIKHLVKLRLDSSYRKERGRLLISGRKLVSELGAHMSMRSLLTTHPSLIPPEIKTAATYLLTAEVLKKVTGLIAPDGLAAEIEMPVLKLGKISKLLAVDGVADPGNLGTLFRTALALGWDGLFLLPNSCDPYNEKAMRASRGAVLLLPWESGSWDALLQIVSKYQLQPFVADLTGDPIETISIPPKNTLLVLGSEPSGPSAATKMHCRRITIPMCKIMESLNVASAGGILLYYLGRHDARAG